MQVDSVVEVAQVESRRPVWTRPWIWVWVLLPFVVLAIRRSLEGPGIYADDAGQYLMHAQALAEGRAYSDINYIYTPRNPWIGPRVAPPGLPLTLAVVLKVFGPNLAIMKAVMLFFATAFLLISGLYFARHDDPRMGLAVALLSGLPPMIVYGSSQLLTDLPFAALIWAVIYLLDDPNPLSWKRVAAITILGGSALAYRVAGIALIPALLAFVLVNYKRHGLRPAIPAVLWFVALLILALRVRVGGAAELAIHPGRVFQWLASTISGSKNLQTYLLGLFEGLLYPLPGSANDIYHLLAVPVMGVGLLVWLRRSIVNFGGLFLLAYACLILIVPVTDGRYLWVLYPFFIYGLLNGVAWLAGVLKRQPRRISVALAFAVLVFPLAAIRVLTEPAELDLMKAPEVRGVVAYMNRIRESETPRVTFYKPRSFAYATGIAAMGPVTAPQPCLLTELRVRRITHVISGRVGERGNERGPFERLARSNPDLFTAEFHNTEFTVYRFHSFRAAPWTELVRACEAARKR